MRRFRFGFRLAVTLLVLPATSATGAVDARAGCAATVEVRNVRIQRSTHGPIDISWDSVDDPCLGSGAEVYRVYTAATAKPLTARGDFPADPQFRPVGSAAAAGFSYLPAAGDGYFLVVAIGSDGAEGPSGHYELGCPCFDTADLDDRLGYLVNLHCSDSLPVALELRGSRGPDPAIDPGSPNAFIAGYGPAMECAFHDSTHGRHATASDLTEPEWAVCAELARSSAMFARNHCPPTEEVPIASGSFPNGNYTLASGQSESRPLILGNIGNSTLAVQLSEEPSTAWLDFAPQDTLIGAGGHRNGFVFVNAAGLAPGQYSAALRQATNDLKSPLLSQTITLTVTAPPDIDVSPPALDFGVVPVDTQNPLYVEVANVGGGTLTVSFVGTSGFPFITITPGFSLAAGESRSVGVVCYADRTGEFEGSLDLVSNAPDEGMLHVPLTCTVVSGAP